MRRDRPDHLVRLLTVVFRAEEQRLARATADLARVEAAQALDAARARTLFDSGSMEAPVGPVTDGSGSSSAALQAAADRLRAERAVCLQRTKRAFGRMTAAQAIENETAFRRRRQTS